MNAYRVTDRLFLWLLTDPTKPVPIGELNSARSPRGVSMRYTDHWLARALR